jgi:hypothetical protein
MASTVLEAFQRIGGEELLRVLNELEKRLHLIRARGALEKVFFVSFTLVLGQFLEKKSLCK